jgi:GNAT superfamily N-acetyltransferase
VSGEPIQPSEVLIAPLTFLQVYQSAGEVMSAMLEKDAAARDLLGGSPVWRNMARFSAVPTYLHWVTSGYAAIVGTDMIGWLFVRGREQVVYVEVLAIHHEWRRKGVGRILLRFAEGLARELNRDWIGITVTLENSPALTMYETEGFRRSHWHVMSADALKPKPAESNGKINLRPVFGLTAEWAFRHFASRDILEHDEWDSDPARRMLAYDRHRAWGQDWVIEAGGSAVGYLNSHIEKRKRYLYLAANQDHWIDPVLIAKVLSVAKPGDAVTLRLASLAHHEAACDVLGEWGFAERPAEQLWMLKSIRGANSPSTPLQGI